MEHEETLKRSCRKERREPNLQIKGIFEQGQEEREEGERKVKPSLNTTKNTIAITTAIIITSINEPLNRLTTQTN